MVNFPSVAWVSLVQLIMSYHIQGDKCTFRVHFVDIKLQI